MLSSCGLVRSIGGRSKGGVEDVGRYQTDVTNSKYRLTGKRMSDRYRENEAFKT